MEAGLPLPRWDDPPSRRRADPIDDTPWHAQRHASLRAMHERLGKLGLAFAWDGSLCCVKCKVVVMNAPRGRVFAIGTTGSALAMWHQASGCS